MFTRYDTLSGENGDPLDFEILSNLRFGPIPIDQLQLYIKLPNIDKRLLYQRLGKLKDNELVASELYHDYQGHKFALYAISENGAAAILEDLKRFDYNIQPEHFRMNFPSVHTVAHELVVTNVVRTLVAESAVQRYFLSYVDEWYLRKSAAVHKQKKSYFPDLHLRITPRGSDYAIKGRNVEIDMGTVKKLDILQKLLSYKDSTLMIISTTMRIQSLQAFLAQHEELYAKVAFTTIYDFCRPLGGLIGADWITINGRKAIVLLNK